LPLQWSSSSPALWLRGRNCPAVAEEAATVVAAVAAPLHPRAVTAVAEEAAVVPLHPPAAVTAVMVAEAASMAVTVVVAVPPLWHLPEAEAVTAEVTAVMAVAAVLPLWRLRTAVATVLPSMVAAEAAL
jgi:hypothetical protein